MFVDVRRSAVAIAFPAEQHGSQVLRDSGVEPRAPATARAAATWPTRRCATASPTSSVFVVATTNASNGAVIAGHDALTALGGAVPIVNMFIGEVIFGGVGSGLYGMLFYVMIAVFVAGLMVGRTPEYLGKKIDAREVKLAAVGDDLRADDRARAHRHVGRHRPGARVDLQPGRARLLRGALRLRLAGEQQRQRLRRLRRDRVLRASWAGSRCGSAASCRSIAALALAGALAGAEDRAPPPPARSAPTTPTFVVPARRA